MFTVGVTLLLHTVQGSYRLKPRLVMRAITRVEMVYGRIILISRQLHRAHDLSPAPGDSLQSSPLIMPGRLIALVTCTRTFLSCLRCICYDEYGHETAVVTPLPAPCLAVCSVSSRSVDQSQEMFLNFASDTGYCYSWLLAHQHHWISLFVRILNINRWIHKLWECS